MPRKQSSQRASLANVIIEQVNRWDTKLPGKPIALGPEGVKYIIEQYTTADPDKYGESFSKSNQAHFISNHVLYSADVKFRASTNSGHFIYCKSRPVLPDYAWFGKRANGKPNVAKVNTSNLKPLPAEPKCDLGLPEFNLLEDIRFDKGGACHIYFIAEPGYLKTTMQMMVAEKLIVNKDSNVKGIVIATGKKQTLDQLAKVSTLKISYPPIS